MEIEKIIKLLRRGMLSDTLLQLAADTIEELAIENNRQKQELERLNKQLSNSQEALNVIIRRNGG